MRSIHLHGCRAEPLLSYLSGLGVVRLVAEQLESDVSARWDGDHLVLVSEELHVTALIDFLADDYLPTAVVAPWNSGGGFQDEGKHTTPSAQAIVSRVLDSDQPRLSRYREAITTAHEARREARRRGWTEGGRVLKHGKAPLIEFCRATLPDEALAWIDAAAVLLDEDIAYPLILGTGGNIGRMDLSVSFLEQLEALGLFDGTSDGPKPGRGRSLPSRPLLHHALFRESGGELCRGSASQFDPGGLGGPNSPSHGDNGALTNPWSFVLGIEGSLVFASAAARRLSAESNTGSSRASMPFTVEATAVGYASTSNDEQLKGELWMPLWRDQMSYGEIRLLISEGRSQWGRNQARSGLDFVRATATLGVDRSVDEFVRYLIGVRNGQSPLAVPIGRFKVSERVRPEADILRQLDGWVGRARSNRAPAGMNTALNALDRAQFAVARFGGAGHLQAVLAELGEAEQAAARSPSYRDSRRLDPIMELSAREWVPLLDDGSSEFRVAVGLASLSDRASVGRPNSSEPVGGSLVTILRPVNRARHGLSWSKGGPKVCGLGHRSLFDVLSEAVGARGAFAAASRSGHEGANAIAGLPFAFDYGLSVSLTDVGRLLCGHVDQEHLSTLLRGLLLLEWKDSFSVVAGCLAAHDDAVARLHAASWPTYVVLAPFFAGRLPVAPTYEVPNPDGSMAVRPRPEWIGAIRAGSANNAARSAARLLRGRGWKLISNSFERTPIEDGRLAAALLLHLDPAASYQPQVRFLLNQQSTNDTRWHAGREG